MTGYVYFIQSQSGHIKIGYAKDVVARLAALQCANPEPLTLIGTVPGTRGLEVALHKRFAAHRLLGEWFTANADILQFIKAPNHADTGGFAGLIRQWGIAEFAGAIGIGYDLAASMVRRNSIPPAHWPAVIAASAERGSALTADDLVSLVKPKRQTKPKSEGVAA